MLDQQTPLLFQIRLGQQGGPLLFLTGVVPF